MKTYNTRAKIEADIKDGVLVVDGDVTFYESIKCLSIKAKREKHSEPICLDGSLIIKEK